MSLPSPTGLVRAARPGDEPALRAVCLRTGDSGQDATGKYADDDLLPDIFLSPYLALEAEHAFVLELAGRPVGYIVGAADSTRFADGYRREWLPRFAVRHPRAERPRTATEALVELGHAPERMIGPDQALFPAHLHIDLLPEAQGHGWGRALMRHLLGSLRAAGVPGVQLGVGERNTAARAFYRRLGFAPLPSAPEDPLRLGIRTDAEV